MKIREFTFVNDRIQNESNAVFGVFLEPLNRKAVFNIPETDKKRVVIVGGGFAGLKLLRKIIRKGFQIVMIDKNNFHQFQPLLYQVATAGLEPSAISFPVRKILQKEKQIHFRIAEIIEIHSNEKEISTSIAF